MSAEKRMRIRKEARQRWIKAVAGKVVYPVHCEAVTGALLKEIWNVSARFDAKDRPGRPSPCDRGETAARWLGLSV